MLDVVGIIGLVMICTRWLSQLIMIMFECTAVEKVFDANAQGIASHTVLAV